MIFRGTICDVTGNPFEAVGPASLLRVESDGALVVRAGEIVARGAYEKVRPSYADDEVVQLTDGLLLPGFVDTHVHYPQARAIGGLGLPLLEWLDRVALPAELRMLDPAYASVIAKEFIAGLVAAGTTTALVFGAHFAGAMDALFAEAERSRLRITAGLVVSDRALPGQLLTTPRQAFEDGQHLIERWHGRGCLRYAVTPRFSLSASDALLEACGALAASRNDLFFTSHLNESQAEIAAVRELFPARTSYLDTYSQHGLVGPRSVFAHNVHASDAELEQLAAARSWIAHCPTSNAALGSGLFDFRRHVAAGVGVALGTDVGAGTGFNVLKEGLQALFVQQLSGVHGLPLTPVHLLYLATRAGALALGLADHVGDFSVGRQFDAVWLRPQPSSTLESVLQYATDASDAIAKVFALGTPADIAGVWVAGEPLDLDPRRDTCFTLT